MDEYSYELIDLKKIISAKEKKYKECLEKVKDIFPVGNEETNWPHKEIIETMTSTISKKQNELKEKKRNVQKLNDGMINIDITSLPFIIIFISHYNELIIIWVEIMKRRTIS